MENVNDRVLLPASPEKETETLKELSWWMKYLIRDSVINKPSAADWSEGKGGGFPLDFGFHINKKGTDFPDLCPLADAFDLKYVQWTYSKWN